MTVRPQTLLPSNPVSARATKYVFVTGGVVSALGKGIVAASLGRLLKARGLRVQLQKFDPYLNVDPGTMSPFQHGEVFVTEDGAETDLDIGHYERFVDENFLRNASHSAGAVWDTVLRKERKGDFLGATVQGIPHITNEIKARIRRAAESSATDVVISEIGGTVGDIESLPFLEAIRQFRREVGLANVMYVHVTLVPFIEAAGELKTKPPQHSVNVLLNGSNGDFCARCHSAVAGYLSESPDAAVLERHEVSRESVTCISCHRISKTYNKVSGRFAIVPGDLTNPVYGGAYAYGKTEQRLDYENGEPHRGARRKPREQWLALIPRAHEG